MPARRKNRDSRAVVATRRRIVTMLKDKVPRAWKTEGRIIVRRFATDQALPSALCIYKVFDSLGDVEVLLAESDPFPEPNDAIHSLAEKVYYDNYILLPTPPGERRLVLPLPVLFQ